MTGGGARWSANGQLARCARDFVNGYDPDFLKSITEKYTFFVRETMIVPKDDEIFLFHNTADPLDRMHGCLLMLIMSVPLSFISRDISVDPAFDTCTEKIQ